MSKDIRIKRGLNLRLKGAAEKVTANAPRSRTFNIRPVDFHLTTPKMVVKEGAKLKAGDEVFYSKDQQDIRFLSPVSGTLTEVKRGAKRVITDVIIEAESEDSYRDFGVLETSKMTPETVKARLLEGGCWPFIKQRPYDVIANPEVMPSAIYISGFNTAPLAADYDFVLQGQEAALQAALDGLAMLTTGRVHVSVPKNDASPFKNLNGIELHSISGPHPAGNVGTLIGKVGPVNKGEVVWTIGAQDLVIIGNLFLSGHYKADRTIALAGSSVKAPKYYKTKLGAEVSTFVYDSGLNEENVRVISGDVLSGRSVSPKGHLGHYNTVVSIIPEGNDYEFFGWNKPIFNKISATRNMTFSWMQPKKEFELNTNTNGEHRAFVLTGMYEKVFPLDIFPMQILKACMVKDLDAMEQLGMYEVAPEDFALTEFVCVSKQPHQKIIREGLDIMYKEIG
ncbi:MAG: Na(+)-translocating NADH-quinone reductase subunit A [Gilvibacter sp.]